MTRLPPAFVALLLLAPACADEKAGPDTPAGDDETGGLDSSPADTGPGPDADPPCADGTWGLITEGDAVHVRADGDDTAGTGAEDAPVATLARALALVREEGAPRRIAVGPGTYAAALELEGETVEHAADDGVSIEACGPDEVTFEASDPGAPALTVSRATDVVLTGFTLSGGTRTLKIWNGASVVGTSLAVVEPTEAGIVVDGADCIVSLVDCEVRDVIAVSTGGDDVGYGISVSLATLEMEGGGVWGATAAGIVGEGATLELADLTVADTASDTGGFLGRGIQSQELGTLVASGLTLSDNADAGLFSLRSWSTSLDAVAVQSTAAAAMPDVSGVTTGDGIVVTQGDGGLDPSTFTADLTACEVTDSARAGIVLDGITATLSGNLVSGSGYEVAASSILAQQGAVVTGGDTVAEMEAEGQAPLDLYDAPMSIVDLSR